MQVQKALIGRLLVLLPMAFCIFAILDSQDKAIRLLAVIGLIVLEQMREWMLVSAMKSAREGKDSPLAQGNKR